jgi:hypothetical protein
MSCRSKPRTWLWCCDCGAERSSWDRRWDRRGAFLGDRDAFHGGGEPSFARGTYARGLGSVAGRFDIELGALVSQHGRGHSREDHDQRHEGSEIVQKLKPLVAASVRDRGPCRTPSALCRGGAYPLTLSARTRGRIAGHPCPGTSELRSPRGGPAGARFDSSASSWCSPPLPVSRQDRVW